MTDLTARQDFWFNARLLCTAATSDEAYGKLLDLLSSVAGPGADGPAALHSLVHLPAPGEPAQEAQEAVEASGLYREPHVTDPEPGTGATRGWLDFGANKGVKP